MPKPIAVMYVPRADYFGFNFSLGEMMSMLNGDNPKITIKSGYSDYLWFVFEKRDLEAPELQVFHEKDFTEIQQEELKKMVIDHLHSIENQPPQQL